MNTLVEEKIAESIVLEDVEEAVRGALWLDEHLPSWHKYIDTYSLDISDSQFCIRGQLEMSGHNLGFNGYPVDLGFDIQEDTQEGPSYPELNDAWIREIDKRKAMH